MRNSDVSCDHSEFYSHLFEQDWAANVKTTFSRFQAGDYCVPVTMNEAGWKNSYVVSPYSIIPYLKEEMRRNCFPILRVLMAPVFLLSQWILKMCRINKVVMVNNHPLSTNLYPPLNQEKIEALHKKLLKEHPDHAIIYRSLNPFSEGPLMESLQKLRYRFITNRSIYFYTGKNLKAKHRHKQKNDRVLFLQEGIEIVPHSQLKEEDAARLKQLYDLLYIEKYSPQNPQYTEEFFRQAIRRRSFHLTGIRYQGVLVGVMGYYARNGVMTPPIVGYDTSYPQSLGLYRMITQLMIQEGEKHALLLHMSSGAAEFKRNRGCHQEIESMGVYIDHLPFYRRLPWIVFGFLFNKIGKPLLIKRRL